jgi:hypothetical protein
MTDENRTQTQGPLQKDPDDWKTGDERMTPAQRSYLETLAHDTGEGFATCFSSVNARPGAVHRHTDQYIDVAHGQRTVHRRQRLVALPNSQWYTFAEPAHC